jgi:hypothetical protein
MARSRTLAGDGHAAGEGLLGPFYFSIGGLLIITSQKTLQTFWTCCA